MSFTSLRYEKAGRIAAAALATPDKLNGITVERPADIKAPLADRDGERALARQVGNARTKEIR